MLGGATEGDANADRNEWSADEELRLIAMSNNLAEYLGIDLGEAAGQPLTRVLRLEEDELGEIPLVMGLPAAAPSPASRPEAAATTSAPWSLPRMW